MRRVAMTDALTEIGNRRSLELHLRTTLAEFDPENGAALIFIDIDNFKQFNNTHGHKVGDQVLKMVAKTLHYNLRATDALGRWGGEEFLVILHDCDKLETLNAVAEKLRVLVASSSFDHNGATLNVTVSMGATFARATDTPESLVHRADRLMYASKHAGRNCVTVE
jgi:diguanylate cyclase (GGDEF)-like protein